MGTINHCIIIAGGSSIKPLITAGLWSAIENKFTLGVNHSFKDFIPTALCSADVGFYTGHVGNKKTVNAITGRIDWVYDEAHMIALRQVPLMVFPDRHDLDSKYYLKNTVFTAFDPKICINSGLFALDYAVNVLKCRNIYLLGMDWGNGASTHYYTHTSHRGIDNRKWYYNNDYSAVFQKYAKQTSIFNVSPISRINCFKYLDGEMFLKIMRCLPAVDQYAARNSIMATEDYPLDGNFN